MNLPKLTITISFILIISFLIFSNNGFIEATNVESLKFSPEKPLNALTYFFLHSGISHLIANIIMILAGGTIVENKLGKKDILSLFFGSAIVTPIIFSIFNQTSLIGASAGATSLLIAGFALDWKKTLTILIIAALIGFGIVTAINYNVEKEAEQNKDKIKQLEREKQQAKEKGEEEKAKEITKQIQNEEKRMIEIDLSILYSKSISVNVEIHLISAIYGALYLFLIRKEKIYSKTS